MNALKTVSQSQASSSKLKLNEILIFKRNVKGSFLGCIVKVSSLALSLSVTTCTLGYHSASSAEADYIPSPCQCWRYNNNVDGLD
jgi:hypothetical protein